MTGFKIKVTNVKLKDGKIEKVQPYANVSQKIAQKTSKKVTVKRR